MALEQVTARIREKLSRAAGLKARVKFDFSNDGIVFVDTTQNPPEISHEDKEADTTLICALETFEDFLNGTQDPNIAFMTGRLRVQGSLGLAMKLNAILED